MKKYIVTFILFFITSVYSQTIYTVSKNGDDDFKNITQVNNFNFKVGDVVSFKSGEEFSDEKLICQSGVTYNTFGGSEKAMIGNPNFSVSDPTIEVKEKNVTIDNLLISGYNNSKNVITYSADNLTVTNCEIRGGSDSHIKLAVGIRQINTTSGNGHKFTHNKIHDLTYGMYISRPENVEVAYNEMFDFYRVDGTMDHGGYAIGGDMTSGLDDTWDSKYTYWIHHNNIYNFEYTVFAVGASRMLIEYNEIHHNLDERIYRGGVKHGSIGKVFDNTRVKIGSVGTIFRYNYVHDLIRRGEANYTYGLPTQWNFDNNTPNIASTNNGTGKAVYLKAVSNNENNFGENFGDGPGEAPGAIIGGIGYGNMWVHNNIFENCSNRIFLRTAIDGENYGSSNYRKDLSTYILNNTIINCGFRKYVTNDIGLMNTEWQMYSDHIVVNNIIDFTNPEALTTIYVKGNESPTKGKLYIDNNIYTNQGKVVTSAPNYGDQAAVWFAGSKKNHLNGNNEQFFTTPDWNSITNTIFASNIGPDGTNIPDVRIKEEGNSNNKGRDFSLLGDSFSDPLGKHELGKDPTGRSFTYDLLGNIRETNDIGALGTSGSLTPQPQQNLGLRVYLEAPFNQNSMEPILFDSKFLPNEQPYDVEPWLFTDNNSFNYSNSKYIDWVIVELRESISSAIAQKTGLLDEEGNIKNSDGTDFKFSNVSDGEYFISVKHRNHLCIMSSEKIEIKNNEPISYDFTDNLSKSYGDNSMFQLDNNKWAMFAGDGNGDGIVNNLDFGEVANNIPTSGYYNGDLNMDGVISVLDYSLINKNLFKSSKVPN